ncbi:MAG: DUF1285 domain-containing protein [Pseudomonadota bacterium]
MKNAFEQLERDVAAGGLEQCGDLGLAIDREGQWFYRGSPIHRPGMVKLFASVLRRTSDGRYWLVTPGERGTIEVADVPFVAVAARIDGQGQDQRVELVTNLDERVTLGPEHGLRLGAQPDGSVAPYVAVRDGLEARLARPVYYELVEHAVEADGRIGLWSEGRFFALDAP